MDDKAATWLALAEHAAMKELESHPPAMCLDKCPCPRHALLALIAAVRAGLALGDELSAMQGSGPGYDATRACGNEVRKAITRELLGEGG